MLENDQFSKIPKCLLILKPCQNKKGQKFETALVQIWWTKGKPKGVDETSESESHVEIGKEMKTFSASRYV